MKRFVTFDTGDTMYHLGISYAHPHVLSGGSPGRMMGVAKYLDHVDEIVESDRKLVTVHGAYKGLPVTAFSSGMGPASVSIVLPEIIEACEDPKMVILRLGTSGGLQTYLDIGDFVVTTNVDRHESTSDKIMGKDYVAASDLEVREALINAARSQKEDFQNVFVGRTKVTDDIYFDALESKGEDHGDVLAVSMEFSVYCALRDRYNRDYGQNIKAGNLLVISDNLVKEHEGQVDMTEFLRKKELIEKAHIKAGLEALLAMSRR